MQNTQLNDNGLSRGFKLPAGYITQYQSWPAFLADACSAAGISCDITGLRAAGVSVFGTDYSKATCLPDSVEQAIWGNLAANRDIGQALQQLRSLITTAQSTANGRLKSETGEYYGDGGTTKRLNFSIEQKIVIVSGASSAYPTSPLIMLYGATSTRIADEYNNGTTNATIGISWGGMSVTWNATGYSNLGGILNNSGYRYRYIAIG